MRNLLKIIVFVLFPISVFGQINFYKQFSNPGTDIGEGIVQLEDSSYVICGSSSSFVNHSQAFLLKVDSLGNFIWSRNYGGVEQESARRVLYQQNFGFFLAGYTNSMGAGSYDYYLAKTDELGVLEWEKTFGGEGWDRVRDAVMTSDTGVVMVGELSNEFGNADWYVIRTDQNGDTLWTKRFGRGGDDVANCVRTFQDTLLMIGGTVYNEDSLMTKSMIVYMHENGTVLDSLEMGGNGFYELNDLTISSDSIQTTGSYKVTDTSGFKITYFTVQINGSSLQYVSDFFYDQTGDNYGQLITTYGDAYKRYSVLGRANQAIVTGPGQDQYITMHGPTLAYLGSACWMTGAFPDVAGQIIPTSDGGAMITGYRGGIGPGEGTIFLLKIGQGDIFPVFSVTLVSDLVSADELDEVQGLKIYPNPTAYELTIEIENPGQYEVAVQNMLGEIVLENEINSSSTLDVSSLTSGSYFVTIANENSKSVVKILVH